MSAVTNVLADARAYRLFHFAALWMIPLAALLAIAVASTPEAVQSYRYVLYPAAAIVGVVGAFTSIVLTLGMLVYLMGVDKKSWKLLWLILFLFGGPFACAIYFFRVYRTQVGE